MKHFRSTVLLWRRRKWVISQGIWGWGDSRFLEQLSVDSDKRGTAALHKDMHFARTFMELENQFIYRTCR